MSGSGNVPLFIELEFEQLEDGIVMHLNRSPLGQRLHGRFELPFSSAELSAKLEAIECKRLSAGELEGFGQRLYRAMAQTHVGQAISKALGLAYQHRGRQAILQLRFDEQAIDLLAIPWELLHDGRRYLVGNGFELTRYIDYTEEVSPLEVAPPLRVLQVVASPHDLPPLDVQRASEALNQVENIVVERLSQPTYRAMRRQLRKKRYHVLHFDGHGMVENGQNVLYFQDKRGKSVPVTVVALQKALGNQVDLVVLNACQGAKITGPRVFNSLAPALIAVGIPAVVGMQFSILDQSAGDFIEAFYEAVANLEPLTQAIAEARGELDLSNEWYIPTLYLRSSDPIGRLFAPTEPPDEGKRPAVSPTVSPNEAHQEQKEPPVAASTISTIITFQDKMMLVEMLLTIPTIADRDRRAAVLGQLRAEIKTNISHNATDRTHVFNIVNTCLGYRGGMQELRDVLHFFEQNSIPMQRFENALDRFLAG